MLTNEMYDAAGTVGTDPSAQSEQNASSKSETENSQGTKSTATKASTESKRTFTQEELNDIIEGRLAKAKKAWDKELADKQSEAEKLAKMDADQKKTYEFEKRVKDLEKREAEITRRELKSQALEMLEQKNLPKSLVDLLNLTDADSCKASIDAVEKAFSQAVQADVDNKLKGDRPITKAPGAKTYTKEQINNMSAAEINANWEAIQESLKKIK